MAHLKWLVVVVAVCACGTSGGNDAGSTGGGSAGGGTAGGAGGGAAGGTAGGAAGGSAGGTAGGSAGGSGGGTAGGTGGGSVVDAGFPGFRLTVPALTMDAGTETAFCYYFRTPNTAAAMVKSWRSRSTPAVTYLSLWFTATEQQPAGTLATSGCGQDPATAGWAYSAWEPDAGWSFPADDGAGHPLGKALAANQPGFLYFVASNATDSLITSAAHVDLELYAPDAGVTQADSLVAFNGQINIPPNGTTSASATCPAPAGAQLTWVSMFTHKQGTGAAVIDGASMLFNSTDWQHPGAYTDNTAPFYAPTNALTYRCDYTSVMGRTIQTGFSFETDELCMMLSYFYPSTRPRVCYNSTLLP